MIHRAIGSLVLFLFSCSAVAESLSLTCGPDGSLVGFQQAAEKFDYPAPTALSDQLAKLRKDAEAKRKADTDRLCAEATACFQELEARSIPLSEHDTNQITGLAASVATVLSMTIHDGAPAMKGTNDSIKFTHAHSKAAMGLLKQQMAHQDPAKAQDAVDQVRALLRDCKEKLPTVPVKKSPADSAKSKVALSYPFQGINRNKIGTYDRMELQRIAEHAIVEGIDPFAAMSIVVLENAAMGSDDSGRYGRDFGRIPVDAIALYDALGCASSSRNKPRYSTAEEISKTSKLAADFDRAQAAVEAATARLRKDPVRQSKLEAALSVSTISSVKESLKTTEATIAEIRAQLSGKLGPEAAKEARQNLAIQEQAAATMRRSIEDAAKAEVELQKDPPMKALMALHNDRTQAQSAQRAFEKELAARDPSGKKQNEISCLSDRKKCYGFLGEQTVRPTIDLSAFEAVETQFESRRMFCSDVDRIIVGSGPVLSVRGDANGGSQATTCCAEVKSRMSEGAARRELLTAMGAKYIARNIQSCMGKQPTEMCLQRFNGLGCFGCTEKMDNACYDGIVGADRPIYGARAADLMLNSLMNNKEIASIVKQAATRIGKPVRSSFCAGQAPGARTVAASTYLDLQKKYLLNAESGLYSLKFGRELRPPQTTEERAIYAKREEDRAKACSVYFK